VLGGRRTRGQTGGDVNGRAWRAGWRLLATLAIVCAVGWHPAMGFGAQDCPPVATPGQRYVVWLSGFLSSSLTTSQPGTLDPANHQVRDHLAPLRAALAAELSPPPQFVYFSYGATRLRVAGGAPTHAWLGDSYHDENEPRYWPQDTSDFPLQAHTETLGWLVRDLLQCDPAATFDVIGYSLGGVVALRWVATEDDGPARPLNAVHRVVVIDSPVGGLNPALLAASVGAAPPQVAAAAGSGLVLGDLLPGGDIVRSLPSAWSRVDVAAIENSRDYLVNGAPVPGSEPGVADRWLARGAAVSLPPAAAADVYYADMGEGGAATSTLWEFLVGIHGAVLSDAGAHERLVELLRTDGPLWRARQP
jgi:hypothetical protein